MIRKENGEAISKETKQALCCSVNGCCSNFGRIIINLETGFRSAGAIWIKNQQTLVFSTMVISDEISTTEFSTILPFRRMQCIRRIQNWMNARSSPWYKIFDYRWFKWQLACRRTEKSTIRICSELSKEREIIFPISPSTVPHVLAIHSDSTRLGKAYNIIAL